MSIEQQGAISRPETSAGARASLKMLGIWLDETQILGISRATEKRKPVIGVISMVTSKHLTPRSVNYATDCALLQSAVREALQSPDDLACLPISQGG
ncbi:BgTH12-02387 [Blumeria graminis f. sp. triticale]|uniref:Bgt-943 n=3 Tax=Blumeria graminis TaxID=34373 RepID=A0A061HBI7_BLUGR|nr:hypothetical protein BGT96224_943 [Blumeria graminis f. sp. tritici 96224]CAD6502146.1 BgTH12-02387 [Blumeria graminis f. sp. triticale]VDB86163.1 Bgt-943 [Blumeria graminis f. sp. tritici]